VSRTFDRHRDAIRMTLRSEEAALLERLAGEMRASLERPDPGDPVHSRLFPPAVLGDPQAEGEVRDLLADALLEERLAGLEAVLGVVGRARRHRGRLVVDLTEEEPLLLLQVLNDIRLGIGARIDIEALDREQVRPEDELAYPLAVMDHLGWWQEQLLMLLDGEEA